MDGTEADGKIDSFGPFCCRDVQTYEVSGDDLSDRCVGKIPNYYARMAEMERLGYTGPQEMLAERYERS